MTQRIRFQVSQSSSLSGRRESSKRAPILGEYGIQLRKRSDRFPVQDVVSNALLLFINRPVVNHHSGKHGSPGQPRQRSFHVGHQNPIATRPVGNAAFAVSTAMRTATLAKAKRTRDQLKIGANVGMTGIAFFCQIHFAFAPNAAAKREPLPVC